MDYPKSVPNVGLVGGKFVDENTATGVVGSLIPSAWGNAVTDELLTVIKAAGLEPTEGKNTQLLASFNALKGFQRFTSSGSFTVPAGVTQIWVSGCAGGGGGAGVYSIGAAGNIAAGGGGGAAGQSIIRQRYAVTPGQVIAINIGSGGIGGVVAGNGGTGGVTSVGSLVTLAGGGGGGAGAAGSSSQSWAGGPGGAGYPGGGDASDVSAAYGAISGAGASCPFGGGGGARRSATDFSRAGYPASGFGAGGGGAGSTYGGSVTSPGNSGGPGAPGIIDIEW